MATTSFQFPQIVMNSADTGLQTIDLEIVFDHTGSDTTYSTEDEKILLLDIGDLEWSYDIKSSSFVVGDLRLELADQGLFYDYLLGHPDDAVRPQPDIDPSATVTLSINSVTEFTGKIDVSTTNAEWQSDADERKISFSAFDGSAGILNRTQVYSEPNDNGVRTAVWADTNYPGQGHNDEVRFRGIFGDIFRLIDSTIIDADIYIRNAWTFVGQNSSFGSRNFFLDSTTEDMYLELGGIFRNSSDIGKHGIRNIGDALRSLSRFFCSMSGIYAGEPFFVQLWAWDATRTQTLNGNIGKIKETFSIQPNSFVKITNILDTSNEASEHYNSNGYEFFGDEGAADTEISLEYSSVAWFYLSLIDTTVYSNVLAFGQPGGTGPFEEYEITSADYVAIGATTTHSNISAYHWWYHLSDPRRCKVVVFENISGIGYSFINGIIHNGRRYQPIRMRKSIKNLTTYFECLDLGEDS